MQIRRSFDAKRIQFNYPRTEESGSFYTKAFLKVFFRALLSLHFATFFIRFRIRLKFPRCNYVTIASRSSASKTVEILKGGNHRSIERKNEKIRKTVGVSLAGRRGKT